MDTSRDNFLMFPPQEYGIDIYLDLKTNQPREKPKQLIVSVGIDSWEFVKYYLKSVLATILVIENCSSESIIFQDFFL